MQSLSDGQSIHVHIVYSFLIIGIILSVVILASVPPVSRDALTHHLAIPKLYLLHGGIYEIPDFIPSYYPMNIDLLYLIPLYFHDDITPTYIHFIFGLLTALLIFSYLKRRIGRSHGLLGALIFLSTPVIVRLSSTAYVDLGLIFFSFVSVYYLILWIENRFAWRHIALSGLFCGLGLGTKYTGLMVLFILTSFVPFVYLRKKVDAMKYTQLRAMGYAAFFVFISLFIFSPWMIRNFIWTSNPIYPLFNSLINPAHPIPESNLESYNLFHFRHAIYNEPWIKTLLIPIRIFFQGIDDNPQFFDGKLNPALLILPFFAFVNCGKDDNLILTEKKIFIFFSMLFFAFVVFQHDMRVRYLGPIIPFLVILSVMGIQKVNHIITSSGDGRLKNHHINRIIVFAIIGTLLSINFLYIYSRFNYVKPFDYLSGRVNRDSYIERYLPEYPVIQYANQHLSGSDKILGIYLGNRSYYFDRDVVFDINLLKKIASNAETPDEVLQELKNLSITHLLVNHNLFNYFANQYDLHEKIILKSFFKSYVQKIFFKNSYGLYKIGLTAEDQFKGA